jgi:hypothetical protein
MEIDSDFIGSKPLKYTDFLQDPQGRQSKDVDGHSLSEGNT